MPELRNITLVKVFEEKKGEGQYGPYILFSLYVDDPDWQDQKFGYIQSGKKPTPIKGMKLDKLEFEETQRGQYVNYDAKTIWPKQDKPKPKPQSKPQPKNNNGKDNPFWFCLAYVKDLEIARISRLATKDVPALHQMVMDVTTEALFMMNASGRKEIISKPKPTEQDVHGVPSNGEYDEDRFPPSDVYVEDE